MPKKKSKSLETLYVDAIQDAFLDVQDGDEVDADERLTAQIEALRQCLADCIAYQHEREEDAKISSYGDDLPDDIMPKGVIDVAA